MEIVSLTADIAGILAAIFSLFAWLKAKQIQEDIEKERTRLKQEVQIVLRHGGQSIPLPSLILTRSELTRSEILGRLGMIPTKEAKRFVLSHTTTPEFLSQIKDIMDGKREGTLIIPCTKSELEQFDLSNVGQA